MNIDRRVTNGLAWAGVLLVVGIPAADLVSAKFMGDRAPAAPAQIAMIEPVAPVPAPLSQRPAAPVVAPAAEVAVATPAPVVVPAVVKPPAAAATPSAAQTAGVVDSYLQSGKGLPSYITDVPGAAPAPAPTQVAATPPVRPQIITPTAVSSAPVTPTAPIDPIQVASIPKVAPTPMPLSMRPSPVVVPVAVVAPSNELIVIPPSNGPVPPANVTAADLEDWETGPLSDFLARRQQAPRQAEVDPVYDEDGFFLDDGPNQPRRSDRLVGPASEFYFPFVN